MNLRKKVNRALALTCAVAMTITSLQITPLKVKAAAVNSTKFVVLSTTDLHGKCWGTNVLNDTTVKNNVLTISTAVKGIRAEYNKDGKDNVILVDNGDLFQGTPVSSNNIITANENFDGVTPMAIALKYLNYDGFVLGNHEFNYPWETMQKIYAYLENKTLDVNGDKNPDYVPVLAANLVFKEADGDIKAGDNVFTPWTFKEISLGDKPIKVGILGLENTDCPRWDVVDNYPNIRFAHLDNENFDMAKEAQKYLDEMEAAGCDFNIVVYHSGLGSGGTDELVFGKNTENQALRVIQQTEGIDLMITGHDHSDSYTNNKYKNKNGEDVVVVNGGGTNLTKTEITATEKADGSVEFVLSEQQGNVDVSKLTPDTTLEAMMQPYATAAIEYVNKVCGQIGDKGWDTKTDYYLEQTDTMDLINRAQIARGKHYIKEKYNTPEKLEELRAKYGESYELDVDFSASSVVVNGSYTVKAGPLSMKDIYKFYKYDNSLYILPLKGSEIKEILEYVAENRIGYTIKNGTITYKPINDPFTCPVFYGLDFSYDMAKEPGSRVTIEGFKNGKELKDDQYYNFAINNYHLSNGPFEKYKPEDTIWSQNDDLGGGTVQELIAEYVEEAGSEGVGPDRSKWSIGYSAEIPVEEEVAKKPLEIYDPVGDAYFTEGAVTVKEAAAKKSGNGTVIGQVVKNYGGKYHIIEDVIDGQIYGYLLYDSDNTYTVGDVVAVEGSFYNYNDLPELSPVTKVTVLDTLGAENAIAPEVVKVADINEDYLNKLVVIQDVPANTAEIADETGKITLYSGAKLPDGVTAGTSKVDAVAVVSTYNGLQLRNSSSEDYLVHDGIYDPIADSMFTDGVKNIKEAKAVESGQVTFLGQVAYRFCGSNGADGDVNTIILQDVVDGEVEAMQVYDAANAAKYFVGDIVKVTGTAGAYGGVPQVKNTTVERLATGIAFQPQTITVSQMGDAYLSELVTVKDVTLGSYKADGNTEVTDETGSTNIFKGAAFPAKVAAGDVVDVTGIASKYVKDGTTSLQLRVGSSFDYFKFTETPEPEVDKDAYRIPVVETTDVHGFLLDVSSGNPDTYQYRMARISDAVNDLRADEEKGDVLLLDGGDIYQGNPVSNLLEGQSMIAAYDHMKYDAVALGNHEFDWSVTELLDADGTMGKYNLDNAKGKVSGDSKIPVVCGNIYKAKTGEKVDFTQDYVIVEKEGQNLKGKKKTFKVAIFGYADDYSSDIMTAKIEPYEIREDDITKIEAEAKKLEESGEADVSVLLSHAGAPAMAKKLAKDTAFDMVLGGHTHSDAAKNTADTTGVGYLQTRNQAYTYGYAELCISMEDEKVGAVTVENAENVTVYSSATKTNLYNIPENAANLDAEIIKISDIAVEEVAPVMNVELGTITEQVTKSAIDGNAFSSVAGNFMTELMSAATGAKISFTNGGGIRTEYLFDTEERMLTAGDIYTIAPFCNTLPTFELTYDEVLSLIEYAVGKGASLALRMSGATAYYSNGKVTTLFVGDKLVYNNGAYEEGYKGDDKIIVCTNEYIATLKDTPFKTKTSIEASKGEAPLVDNEAYIDMLKKESKGNNGKIFINTKATLVDGAWDGVTVPVDNSDRFNKASNGGNIHIGLPSTPSKEENTTEKPVVDTISGAESVKVEVETKKPVSVTVKDDKFVGADGKVVTNAVVKTEDGTNYILDKEGKKITSSIVKIATGDKFITADDGAVVKGNVVTVNGAKFYTTKGTGKVVTNKIFKVNGKKYIAAKSGKLYISKWVVKGNVKYYCNKDGVITKSKKIKK